MIPTHRETLKSPPPIEVHETFRMLAVALYNARQAPAGEHGEGVKKVQRIEDAMDLLRELYGV